MPLRGGRGRFMADESNSETPIGGVAFLQQLQYPPKYTTVEINLGGTEHSPWPPRFLALHHQFSGTLPQFGTWLKDRVADCQQAGGWVRDIKVGGGGYGITQHSAVFDPKADWHTYVIFRVEDRQAAEERESEWNEALADFFRQEKKTTDNPPE